MENTITIGIDLGDKFHIAVVFDGEGNELETAQMTNTKTGVSKFFQPYKNARVAMEASTHSPWISRLLDEMGLTVYVGNPRKLRCIWDSTDKSDARDMLVKSRQLGPFWGLTPRRDQSGNTDKQLPITKAGNTYLRRLLVGSAQYIMGPFGPESNLRLHGMSIAALGGKNGRWLRWPESLRC